MMSQNYHRLSLQERFEIEKLLSHNNSLSAIATALNRNKSTISREASRQRRRHCRALDAERRSVGLQSGRRGGKNKIDQCLRLKEFVMGKLRLRWYPHLMSVCLRRDHKNDKAMQVSHETIYLYIHLHCKKELKQLPISELRQKRKYRGNVRRGADKRATVKDPIRVDERPAEVAGREVSGHWEGDLMMSKNRDSAIGTLVGRTTRPMSLVPLKARDAKSIWISPGANEKNTHA
jgi:IS30 family transposase